MTKKIHPDRMTADALVLTLEVRSDFQDLLAAFAAALQPRNYLEEHLLRWIAAAAWRAGRLMSLEKAVLDWHIEQEASSRNEEAPTALSAGRACARLADESRVLDLMGRSEARACRAFKDSLNLFFKVRTQLNTEGNETR